MMVISQSQIRRFQRSGEPSQPPICLILFTSYACKENRRTVQVTFIPRTRNLVSCSDLYSSGCSIPAKWDEPRYQNPTGCRKSYPACLAQTRSGFQTNSITIIYAWLGINGASSRGQCFALSKIAQAKPQFRTQELASLGSATPGIIEPQTPILGHLWRHAS